MSSDEKRKDAESEPADDSSAPADETGAATAVPDPAGTAPGAAPKPRRGLFGRQRKPKRRAPWWELPLLIGLAIIIAILVKTFVVQPFYIPSESMEKTLHGCSGCSGDRILVNKPIYDFRDPHPGDIVVFDAPKNWNDPGEAVAKPPGNPVLKVVRGFGQLVGFVPPDDLVLVKRVIASGGQTVKGVSSNNGKTEQIMISGHGRKGPWRTLNEPYVYLDYPDQSADFGPVTVPKGRLWVMGDHRNRSADSRFHCGGDGSNSQDLSHCDAVASTVPIGDVIGKAFVIAWPASRWRTLGTPSTFTSAAGSGVLPLGFVAPFWLVRRRRRRP
ncbi:MAG: signal peptidase I [Actinomycetota bacterium]|nr:signal peptidase I [Actinomycetota bacterium]